MKRIIFFLFFLFIVSCSQKPNPNFNSVLWVQTAAEYQASCDQAYNGALINIEKAIADTRWTGALEQTNNFYELPPAVIFDIDETILDNSPYQAQLIMNDSNFKLSSWDQWIKMQTAESISGAVDFINYIQNLGVEIIFITNRECKKRNNNAAPCPQEIDTIYNLQTVGIKGIDENNVLLKHEFADWESEKKKPQGLHCRKVPDYHDIRRRFRRFCPGC